MSVRYCGRLFTPDEIERIRILIGEDPRRTRADLSRLACREFNWLKANGGLKEMSARVAMLRMHEDGLIELPPPRCKRPDARIHITQRTDPAQTLEQPAHALAPLNWRPVQTRSQSRLWNEYIQRYHYLGYKTLPGAQLRYFVYAADNPVALLGFGASGTLIALCRSILLRHLEWLLPVLMFCCSITMALALANARREVQIRSFVQAIPDTRRRTFL